MTLLILRVCGWLAKQAGLALAIIFVVLSLAGAWLFFVDHWHNEEARQARIDLLEEQRQVLETQIQVIVQKTGEARAEAERARRQVEFAAQMAERLQELRAFWIRLFLSREERERHARREQEAMQRVEEAQARESRSLVQLENLAREQAALEEQLAANEQARRVLEGERSVFWTYGEKAWHRVRIPLVVGLLIVFLGPTIWKVTLYFVISPTVRWVRPIRIHDGIQPPLEAGVSRVSERVLLQPGETLWVKEAYLQASDEDLSRKTRFMLDWRIPFTCLACGLVELVEMHCAVSRSPGGATLSTQDNPEIEMAMVGIPEDSGLVIRPSFLAALVAPSPKPPRIRRHWRLFSLQSWLTCQFRYFEIRGPARLVLCGSRGVRAEFLPAADPPVGLVNTPGRRTNQDATIGFSSELEYKSVRAETFWSYYRGKNPLFDDLFTGRGVFFCQEISRKSRMASVRRFWASFWNGLTKVFGI